MNNQNTNTVSRGKEVAAIILQQLGGNKFIAMTGTKNFVYDDKKTVAYNEVNP